MIADRQNGRILMVDTAGTIHWQFPTAHGLPAGQRFSADDAFLSPDGKTITANEEGHQVIVRIDIATRRIVWEYGRYDHAGSGPGRLHTPDDAYPLANGDVIVADIGNCRIIEVSQAKKIVRQWGRTGACADQRPANLRQPERRYASAGRRPADHRDPRVASRAPRPIRSCRLRHPRPDGLPVRRPAPGERRCPGGRLREPGRRPQGGPTREGAVALPAEVRRRPAGPSEPCHRAARMG